MLLMDLERAVQQIHWQKLAGFDPTVSQMAQEADHHMAQALALRGRCGEVRAPTP
jgi:hypothetical protein